MLRFYIAVLLAAAAAPAHDVVTTKLTWSAEISRIVYRRCGSCHRAGGRAPMALVTYEEARPWAKAIRDEVLARTMPPWGAARGYGDLMHDASLTQDEITRIAEWVEGGAPEGDAKYLPVFAPNEPHGTGTLRGRRTRVSSFSSPVVLMGLQPLTNVADSKISALFPDGSVVPLVWLRGYQAGSGRMFELRDPVRLVKGTRIVTEPKVPIELVIR